MKHFSSVESSALPDPKREQEALFAAYAEALESGDLAAQDELRTFVESRSDASFLISVLDEMEEAWGREEDGPLAAD